MVWLRSSARVILLLKIALSNVYGQVSNELEKPENRPLVPWFMDPTECRRQVHGMRFGCSVTRNPLAENWVVPLFYLLARGLTVVSSQVPFQFHHALNSTLVVLVWSPAHDDVLQFDLKRQRQ